MQQNIEVTTYVTMVTASTGMLSVGYERFLTTPVAVTTITLHLFIISLSSCVSPPFTCADGPLFAPPQKDV